MTPIPWPLIGRTRRKRIRVADLPTPTHTGGNAEDCPVCRPRIDQPGGVLYPWICTGEPDEPAPTPADLARAQLDRLRDEPHPPASPRPAAPAARYPAEQPMPSNPAPAAPRHEHGTGPDETTAQRAEHPWTRREDAVLHRLAQLTEQHGPWEAAMRLFADAPKETP